ncbi:MAG TPA: universal stress protein [candidate division Zixibacteria bacterium]|nr:universal stress protein [candidate division Zixibacteria bacterium]
MQTKRILAPTDLTERSREGLTYALSLAAETGSALLILYVADELRSWEMMDDELLPSCRPAWTADRVAAEAALDLNRFLEKHRDEMGRVAAVATRVVLGKAPEKIVETARREAVDLIVMAPRPHGAFTRFLLRSVTDRVAREAPCPVLAVSPKIGPHPRGRAIPTTLPAFAFERTGA